jgi:hypothetical protein
MGRDCKHIAAGTGVRTTGVVVENGAGRKVVGKIIEKVFVRFMILAFYASLAAPHVHAAWVALQ